ncbi:MAG: hypothetical protein A2Y34_04360 [Spirochaetes bacterium GWC1_27_15]|nr:MAG: hypothetical protein A2Y34_04360 [Spirochaetes bacterium GWC1_27_15]
MKGFWSDQDGLDIKDVEKLLLSFLLLVIVFTILYMWVFKSVESALINELAYAVGSLLVLRKGLSYFKKDSYNAQSQTQENENIFTQIMSAEDNSVQNTELDTNFSQTNEIPKGY